MLKVKTARQRPSDKRKVSPVEADTVITPAGPLPKDRVHEVGPDETVVRNTDGSYSVVRKR
jgi:hypothetical protein